MPLDAATVHPGVFPKNCPRCMGQACRAPFTRPAPAPPGIRGTEPCLCRGVSPATPVLPQRVIFSFLMPQQPPSPKQPSPSSRGGQETGRGSPSRLESQGSVGVSPAAPECSAGSCERAGEFSFQRGGKRGRVCQCVLCTYHGLTYPRPTRVTISGGLFAGTWRRQLPRPA